jgi:class 3 adenylate cyclase
MLQVLPRSRVPSIILVAAAGLIAGIAYRTFLDDPAERDIANYIRSGLQGVGIALAAWTVQAYFASNAQSSLGSSLRRLPVLGELLVRSLVMTAVIIISGVLLQFLLFTEPFGMRWFTASWFAMHLPWIVAIGLTISLIVGALTEAARMIGRPMLTSIALGTYHRPTREQLIVMFLDLANSTRLAEAMGELRVQDLITRFFFDIEEPIIAHGGTVHAYVGDEVIVTWPITLDSTRNARCLRSFFAIEVKMAGLAARYKREFEVVPDFRAGLHAGAVIVSECGGVKRQLALFGDTMNVSARLCEYCKAAGQRLIVSGDLLQQVAVPADLSVSQGQNISLRGRQGQIGVHVVQRFARNGPLRDQQVSR